MLGATVLLAAPLFAAFSIISARSLELQTASRRQQVIEANANALAKPLWDFDNESVGQISAAIGQASEIRRVVVANMRGAVLASLPPGDSSRVDRSLRLDTTITYKSIDGSKDVGTLTLWFAEASPVPFYRREGAWTAFLFLASILAMVVSAIVGNHHMTVKPIRQLANAIQRTRQLGSRHRVGLRSRTEIGELARTFDDMQDRLAREEAELSQAHMQAVNLYNRAPAMLFSLDRRGSISAVSDYWLSATGYERSQVIGRPFADLVVPDHDETPASARAGLSVSGYNDAIVRFRCAGGRLIVVLVRETGAVQVGADASASLCVMTDITALKEAEGKVRLQAVTDRLTDLLNRHGFEAELADRIAQADAVGGEVGCLYLDLDRFKPINDSLGHTAGDHVLTVVAARLKEAMGVDDTAARIGGDEFSILASGSRVGEHLERVKATIEQALRLPIVLGSRHLSIGASIGSSIYPAEARTASDLIRMSDAAMYRVKHVAPDHGGGHAAATATADERLVADCLANDWIEAHFQPIVSLRTGTPVGFEALMRVRHPRDGVLLPTRLIEAAERTGLIADVDETVMRRAIAGLAQIHADGRYGEAYLTINASSLTIDPSFVAKVLETAARHGVDPRHLILEITETHSLLGSSAGGEATRTFRAKGGRVALDDFGVGHSSFSYLCEDRIDIVKVDRSFVLSLTSEKADKRERAQAILANIGILARHLDCAVIAEGIESDVQRRLVMCAGIPTGQGFLYSRAEPLDEWLRETRNSTFS